MVKTKKNNNKRKSFKLRKRNTRKIRGGGPSQSKPLVLKELIEDPTFEGEYFGMIDSLSPNKKAAAIEGHNRMVDSIEKQQAEAKRAAEQQVEAKRAVEQHAKAKKTRTTTIKYGPRYKTGYRRGGPRKGGKKTKKKKKRKRTRKKMRGRGAGYSMPIPNTQKEEKEKYKEQVKEFLEHMTPEQKRNERLELIHRLPKHLREEIEKKDADRRAMDDFNFNFSKLLKEKE